MFGNVFGYSHAQPHQYSQAHPHSHAQAHAQAARPGKAKSPVKALPAPTVTNASNPYAMMPYTGQGGYPQYAQQQQQAPTVVGNGYPTSLLAAQASYGAAGAQMNELNQVAANLWIGSCRALTVQTLQAAGIRHVVNTAKELKKVAGIDWAGLKRAGIMVMHVPWEDNFTQQIFPSKALNDAVTYIDQIVGQGGNVLVNCAMGRSRSTSLVIAYLIIRRGLSYDNALATVQSHRPICQPNQFFEEQLRNVERSVRMKQTQPQGQQKHHRHQSPANQYSQAGQYQQQAAYQQAYAQPQQHAPTFVGQQYAGGYGGYTNAYPQTARGVQSQGWNWGGQGIGAMW